MFHKFKYHLNCRIEKSFMALSRGTKTLPLVADKSKKKEDAQEVILASHLPEAITGDIDHGVIVGARHRCCPKLHSVCRA